MPPQAPKGDVKSGMRDESEKSTTVTAPFRGLGADVGDKSNLHLYIYSDLSEGA